MDLLPDYTSARGSDSVPLIRVRSTGPLAQAYTSSGSDVAHATLPDQAAEQYAARRLNMPEAKARGSPSAHANGYDLQCPPSEDVYA